MAILDETRAGCTMTILQVVHYYHYHYHATVLPHYRYRYVDPSTGEMIGARHVRVVAYVFDNIVVCSTMMLAIDSY